MAEPLKNVYDRAYIARLARALSEVGVELDEAGFVSIVMDSGWGDRELKARTSHIRKCLHKVLPQNFLEAVPYLLKAGRDFGGYEGMFFPEYVESYGLDFWDESMDALEVLTTFSSAEFAIRPFLQKDPLKGMKKMEEWSLHKNEHVRRLSSEGCRPLLPWASQLKIFRKDPKPILKILENLKTDESLYVRKSVANNLNDISKDHPELALKTAKSWIKNKNPHTVWIVKHGLRTLLKKGEKKALSLFGYGSEKTFKAEEVLLKTPLVILDNHLEFEFDFNVLKRGTFRFEYALHLLKKNGTYTKKVFKISESEL
ncbi:MAG: DNA alkylation repair protein, partial [Halobacteriovoraceae bacterium]|nr:DNA alkylation repair protein [Halobacteriovoraceae bacterium]